MAEGTLFRRWATKEALFRAAMKPPAVPSWVRELDALCGQGDMRDNLMRIVREIIRFAQERIPFVMLRWSHKPSSSEPAPDDEGGPAVARDCRRLVQFLQREVIHERLRPCHTEMVARLLVGPCLTLVMDSVVNNQPLNAEEIERFTEDLVDTLWQGIAPPGT